MSLVSDEAIFHVADPEAQAAPAPTSIHNSTNCATHTEVCVRPAGREDCVGCMAASLYVNLSWLDALECIEVNVWAVARVRTAYHDASLCKAATLNQTGS